MFNYPLHSTRWDGGIWGPPFPVKRKECQLFAEGRCQNGPKCPFLHRIAIKRPVGHCGDEANNSTGPPQQTHDNPSVDSKAGPRESAVSRLNTAQKCLDLRGGLQATDARKPEGDEVTLQQHVQSATSSGQASHAHVEEANTHRRLKTNPCFGWEKTGACARGDTCWYRHEVKIFPVVEPADKPPSSPQAVDGASTYQNEAERRRRLLLKEKPCFAWAKGKCERGDVCWYKHDSEAKTRRVASSVTKGQMGVAERNEEKLEPTLEDEDDVLRLTELVRAWWSES
ncbi:hypothetical protein FA13DRAFT_1780670 [Coprinellus micaceus]|uniref:C3H1-type domain-containing protein n=1 Tax=Coprinellus micaceus TaxID=71717 RepID=A0A4Y7SCH4_COPMI|nr:hypothetical protein FA13DRAFT_1780670 [Coprinellus micaceus]